MDLLENIKSSLKYPFFDYEKFLALGALFIFANVAYISISLRIHNNIFYIVALAVSLIFTLIITGFALDITRNTFYLFSDVPEFDFLKNLLLGVKSFAVKLVYMLIPLIVTVILIYTLGIAKVFYGNLDLFSNMAPWVAKDIFANLAIVAVIFYVLYVIFSILESVAQARLAESDNIRDALTLEVLEDVKKIGFLKIIEWVVIVSIIICLISVIILLVGFIPYVGVFIATFVGYPFITLFYARSLGLLYSV